MKQLSGVRPALKSRGDDVTLTRFVRTNREENVERPRRHQPRIPGRSLAFVEEGRTKYPTRVLQPEEMTTLLVSGHSNIKIGRDVRKGKFRGYWIYTLSLEERKTCPSSCAHWQTCYGNNMPFAKRVDHTAPDFLSRLEAEVEMLAARKQGVLVRLHALGDFYSPEYVEFWRKRLARHANLALYGYTARDQCAIGDAIFDVAKEFGDRSMIRTSDGGYPSMSTVPIADVSARPPGAFICPEQTGQTLCCATCGACWSTTKNVAFLDH